MKEDHLKKKFIEEAIHDNDLVSRNTYLLQNSFRELLQRDSKTLEVEDGLDYRVLNDLNPVYSHQCHSSGYCVRC